MEYFNTGINEYAYGNPTENDIKFLLEDGFVLWRILKDDNGSEIELWVR